MKDKAIDLLRELTEAFGAPGSEEDVRAVFRRELSGFNLSSDRLGGLIATDGEPTEGQPRVMVTGHMDEVGFIVQNVTSDGYIQFAPLGGWWTHALMAQRVRVKTRAGEEVVGVISSTPPHFLKPEDRKKVLPIDSLYIDIGAKDRSQVEEFGVAVGDPVVPDSTFTRMRNSDLLLCKAFDNRVGIGVTIQAMQELKGEKLPGNLFGVATVQEEVGTRGAYTAAAAVKPDVALVIEGPPADDSPGFNKGDSQGALGAGPQIRLMDPTAIMNRKLVEFVRETAEKQNIPHQVTVRRGGGTDARTFQIHDKGVPCVVLGVPARYIHTHNSIIDINDYLATVELVKALVRRIDDSAAKSFADFLS